MEPNLAAQAVREEIQNEIRRRKKYVGFDFSLAHFFLWLSILASFSSAILIAAGLGTNDNLWVAVIAGIPGLVVVVEKSFDFARRSAWGTMYKLDMQALQDKIDFGKIDAYEAAKELREICRRHEAAFLKIGFFREREREATDAGKSGAGVSGNGNGTHGKSRTRGAEHQDGETVGR